MTTEPATAPVNPWAVAQQQFDLAAERLGLDDACAPSCASRVVS